MSAVVSELQDVSIVDFLNNGNGRTVLLTGISWMEYENFLQAFWGKTNLSLAYDNGKLEIMPKSPKHEEFSRLISKFVFIYSEVFDLTVEERGSATFKRTHFQKGVEPDECFYIQNADSIIGLGNWNLEDFPAPDVAVEVDLTTDSLDKFPIYAALQVAEVWIYDGETISFYELAEKNYRQISHSRALALLPAEKLTEFLEMSKIKGQTFALKSFRNWLKAQSAGSE
ncbi:Uma2 family endonuclease [soil metagenome]